MYNEELHYFLLFTEYYLEHVAYMQEKRNEYKILVKNPGEEWNCWKTYT